jgi:hypothetical protein
LKYARRMVLKRNAQYTPKPRPSNEPTLACVETLLPALLSTSRSD